MPPKLTLPSVVTVIAALLAILLGWQVLGSGRGAAPEGPALTLPSHGPAEDQLASRLAGMTDSMLSVSGVDAPGRGGQASIAEGVRLGVGEADPVSDSEWEALERNRRNPEEFFQMARNGKVAASHMFRNVTINEHDRYIPPATRAELAPQLEPLVRTIQMLADIEWKYQESELRRLVATGVIQPEPVGPSPKQIKLFLQVCESQLEQLRVRERAGHDVAGEIERVQTEMRDVHIHAAKLHVSKPHTAWLADERGRFYDLDVRRLPGHAHINHVELYMRMEFYGRVSNYFDRIGILSDRGRGVLIRCASGQRRANK